MAAAAVGSRTVHGGAAGPAAASHGHRERPSHAAAGPKLNHDRDSTRIVTVRTDSDPGPSPGPCCRDIMNDEPVWQKYSQATVHVTSCKPLRLASESKAQTAVQTVTGLAGLEI